MGSFPAANRLCSLFFLQVTTDVAQLLGEDKVDAILCVAGGWAGGSCSSKGQRLIFSFASQSSSGNHFPPAANVPLHDMFLFFWKKKEEKKNHIYSQWGILHNVSSKKAEKNCTMRDIKKSLSFFIYWRTQPNLQVTETNNIYINYINVFLRPVLS